MMPRQMDWEFSASILSVLMLRKNTGSKSKSPQLWVELCGMHEEGHEVERLERVRSELIQLL